MQRMRVRGVMRNPFEAADKEDIFNPSDLNPAPFDVNIINLFKFN